MADQKRLVRMLDEILKVPGNNNCADCKSPAPRWASVNLGIFICVSCATIHRGLGTHHSRVKSVTLDSWTREQVMALKTIGNTASNLIYNPDERRHPPPTSSSTSERDSEMEKYIRKKYELGAFKAGASTSAKTMEPTSMNRYRNYNQTQNQSDRGVGAGASSGVGGSASRSKADMDPWDRPQSHSQSQSQNRRNPELDNLVIKSERKKAEERDLPPLPVSASSTGPAIGRERPKPTSTTFSTAPQATGLGIPTQRTQQQQQQQQQLVDLNAMASNSTLPLQQHLSPNPFNGVGSSGNIPAPQGYGMYMSNSAPGFSPHQSSQTQAQGQGSYFQANSSMLQPQPQPQSQSFGTQSASIPASGYNPFLQQQQQQQNGFFAQQAQGQGQMISPNTGIGMGVGMGMHHTNPFFSSQPTPNATSGYTPQMAVQQAMAGPQQQIFPSHSQSIPGMSGMGMGMGMNQQGQGQGQAWAYNPQQQQQSMGWGNGPTMGYTYAQGQ